MATPLGLFKGSPRWRITVITALTLTITLILVQPDPERQRSRQVQNKSVTKPGLRPPPNLTKQKTTSASSVKQSLPTKSPSRVISQKNSSNIKTIHPGKSSVVDGDMKPTKERFITPSNGSDKVLEVSPKDDEQNALKPSG